MNPNTREIAASQIVEIDQGSRLDEITAKYEKPSSILSRLEQRDKAFVRLMTRVTLRRLGQIDDIINHFLKRPLHKKNIKQRALLRVGVAQLVFLKTPPHAAVNATVAAAGKDPLKGLINAILHRVSEQGEEIVNNQDVARLNSPNWLWNQLENSYGSEIARDIITAQLAEPPTDLTLKKSSFPIKNKLVGEILAPSTIRIYDAGKIDELPGYDEGDWWVQDFAATLPAIILLNALSKKPKDSTIADLCAAPGGKTAQLALSGSTVFSVEYNQDRIKKIESNITRLKLNVNLVFEDVTKWSPSEKFDGILLDAPCSATGTIRRHPDLPWRKNLASASNLLPTQDALLKAAVKHLKPKGVLVYCVCSLDQREGKDRIANLLNTNPNLHPLPILPSEIGGLKEAITENGNVQTLPCHLVEKGGMDGFFISRLKLDSL